MKVPFVDDLDPACPHLTTYDLQQQERYLRLLDAAGDPTANWREAVQILFDLDPGQDERRARHIYDTHLARARWMTQVGYRSLVQLGLREEALARGETVPARLFPDRIEFL